MIALSILSTSLSLHVAAGARLSYRDTGLPFRRSRSMRRWLPSPFFLEWSL
jgi:hypothetical protein